MCFNKYLERLNRMHTLIKMKGTGCPSSFASKIGISRSVLMEHIREMKEMGGPIGYCKFRETYYYSQNCELNINGYKIV